MRRILYFLIGFFLSVAFFLQFANAASVNYGTHCTEAELEAAFSNYTYYSALTTRYYAPSLTSSGLQQVLMVSPDTSSPDYDSYMQSSATARYGYFAANEAACISLGCSGCDNMFDRDDDGIDDDCDVYPDDPNPYQVKRLSYQKDSNGSIVRECYYTDRGDNVYVCIGADYNSALQDTLSISSPWEPADSLCGEGGGLKDPTDGDVPDDDILVGGDPDVGDDDQLKDGDYSDEFDSVDLSKVIDNTAATADNVSRLADYLRDQNVDLSQIRLAIDGLSNDLESGLSGVSLSINSLASQVGVTNTKLDSLSGQIGDSNTKLDNLSGQIGDSNTKLDSISGHVGDSNTKLDSLSGQIGDSNTKLDSISGHVGDSNTKLDSIGTGVTALASAVDSSNAKLDGLVQGNLDGNSLAVDGNAKLDGIAGSIQNFTTTYGNTSSTTNSHLTTINQSISDSNLKLSDLQSAIDTSNSKLSNIDSGVQSVNDFLADSQTGADTGKAEIEGIDVSTYYSPTGFSGDLVENTDYDPAEDFGEQSWVEDFFESNPYKRALDNSGFTLSGSCEATFPLYVGTQFRTINVSLCAFQDQFVFAGQILLRLSTLFGLMLLVRK